MGWLKSFVASTIGQKFVVGLTGLALVLFLIIHGLGNLNIFGGAESLNGYATKLHSIPGFLVVELGLLGMFVVHILMTIRLVMANKVARGSGYAVKSSKRSEGKLAYLASKTMPISGLIVLAFLVIHVLDFRLNPSLFQGEGAAPEGKSTLYDLVITELSVGWKAGLYVVASLLIGWHMFHGIQSAARSLGVNHSRFTPLIIRGGAGLAWLLAILFAVFPILILTKVIGGAA